jgi:phage shock protein E
VPIRITREDVQRMTGEDAVLIEVLPENEYAEEHIVGAVNIPQKQLTAEGTAHLAKDAPLIVYCYDTE